MNNIVFLVSSNGGTLKFIHHYFKMYCISDFNIIGVIGDRECNAIEYAKKNNINNKVITYNKLNKADLLLELEHLNPDIIITNIFKILDINIVTQFKNKLINFHYSLLPAFKGYIGVSTIKKAKEMNCQFIGSTCHIVEEDVDSGKIIGQNVFQINTFDDNELINNIMFRSNCIMALHIIFGLKRLNYSQPNTLKILNKTVTFSPSLFPELATPTEDFWEKIKIL